MAHDYKPDELQHYGVLGMKWGVRKLTYKLRSAEKLQKSANGIKKDIKKLEIKANRQKRRAAKAQMKAARFMGIGNFKMASWYFKKNAKKSRNAQKREKTIWHNKKLLDAYNKRISQLDSESVSTGKSYVDNMISNYGTRRTLGY